MPPCGAGANRRVRGADDAVVEAFSAPGSEIDRLLYGSSVLVCLPTGRAHDHSSEAGALMRPDEAVDLSSLCGGGRILIGRGG